ncbi:MAG: hypothetical protein HXY41_06305 [Chloroflexi bacterium]|nr:hypothetical protein [Chloroflexota bacterium]
MIIGIKKVKLLCFLMGVLLLPLVVLAQEPTDRPFPAAAVTATVEPTDRPFPAAQATATDRPFPAAATATVEATERSDVTVEATSELLLADVQATADAAQARITQLEAERDRLLSELEASRTDNGAATFALVVIVVGVLLALAVFFGLRRSGE